jgi:hypothetical protein
MATAQAYVASIPKKPKLLDKRLCRRLYGVSDA